VSCCFRTVLVFIHHEPGFPYRYGCTIAFRFRIIIVRLVCVYNFANTLKTFIMFTINIVASVKSKRTVVKYVYDELEQKKDNRTSDRQ